MFTKKLQKLIGLLDLVLDHYSHFRAKTAIMPVSFLIAQLSHHNPASVTKLLQLVNYIQDAINTLYNWFKHHPKLHHIYGACQFRPVARLPNLYEKALIPIETASNYIQITKLSNFL